MYLCGDGGGGLGLLVLQLPSFTLNYLEQLDIFKIMTSFGLSQLQKKSVIL
jgi:hypothetical protein